MNNYKKPSWIQLTLIALTLIVNGASANNAYLTGKVKIFDLDKQPLSNLAGVVIFLDGPTANAPAPLLVKKESLVPQMSHKDKQFSPRVLPIKRGEKIDFHNDDNIFHNVFSLSKANPFDLGIYPTGSSKVVSFDRTGLVKIYCNIHPKMISNILVLNNEYFTTSDNDGSFIIKNIPIGKHTIRIWHEIENITKEFEFNVVDGVNNLPDIVINLTKKLIPHKNKFGKYYKSKY
jgi:plastocyanin